MSNVPLFETSPDAGDDLKTLQLASKQIRRQASAKAIARGIESVNRAQSSTSIANDLAVIASFAARGIPEAEIKPRVNVFTFNGWKALGRFVRKGEHGVRLSTVVAAERENPETGETESTRRVVTTYVFHVSQTEPYGVRP